CVFFLGLFGSTPLLPAPQPSQTPKDIDFL
ncbi:MAG: hypothetical protein ACI8V8_002364, partial [Chitinophagales bacterium]